MHWWIISDDDYYDGLAELDYYKNVSQNISRKITPSFQTFDAYFLMKASDPIYFVPPGYWGNKILGLWVYKHQKVFP